MRKSYTFQLLNTILAVLLSTFLMAQESVFMVTINSIPENPTIFIDGKIVEKVNGFLELPKGRYQIVLQKEGYTNLASEIKVSRKTAYFNFEMIKDESYVVVNIKEDVIAEKTEDPITSKNEVIIKKEKPEIISIDSVILQIEMVNVPAGKFLMGSRIGNHCKPHQVELSGFEISKYEVTQDLWLAVMGENPSYNKGMDKPVDNVSWESVQIFLEKLNSITGKKYRLPTEAEWEYAAKNAAQYSETKANKYSGGNSIGQLGWYWRNSGDTLLSGRWNNETIKYNNSKTQEVGQKEPNRLSIYDMTGNVWEWCSDWYTDDYYLNSPKNNPKGPEAGKARVYRGGSYVSKASYCTNSFRFSGSPKFGYNYLGFRLAL